MKANAARILDALGGCYELREYEVDPDDLSAESVALKLGLNLKALARALGDRSVDTVPLKDVLPLTGFVRGRVTAIGGKKNYPSVIDETMRLFDVVSVSAGVRGTQVLLAPDDCIRAVHGSVAPISRVGKA